MPLTTSRPGADVASRPAAGGRHRLAVAAATLVLGGLLLLPDLAGLDRWLPFAAFSALRPALAAVGGGAALVGLLVRRRWWPVWVPLLVVAAVAGALVVPRAVAAPAPPPGGTDLTVLTFNVFEGKADPALLAATIRRTSPDLVVLPEAGERFRGSLAPLLPGYRSWTNAAPTTRDVRGIVVLASPRAGDVTARRLDGDTRYPWAEVTGGLLGGTRLAAVHLVSPVPRWISYWPGELGSLAAWCRPGTGPALVVGDLNATPDHSAFRAGTAGCADAATERGVSPTATWRSTLPRWFGAQIDHVLTTGGPQARDVEVLDLPGSDHRALLVRLRLPAG